MAVIPPTLSQVPLLPSVVTTADLAVATPSKPAQLPLPQSVWPSNRISATLGGSSGHSDLALCHWQTHNDLTKLFSVASLTDSPLLVESVVDHYTSIYRLCMAKRAELKAIQIQVGTTPTPNDVDDIISLAWYNDLYIRACRNSVSKSMWQEMRA